MKTRLIAAAVVGLASVANAEEAPPEGFDTFRADLDFAYTYCTSGKNLVPFDKEALNKVGRKIDDIKKKAGMQNYLIPTPPALTDPLELADKCAYAREELGLYAETVLGIPGLVR